MIEVRDPQGRQLRDQLSRLNALLVLSMLMLESTDEAQVLQIGATSVPSFADCHLIGVATSGMPGADRRWVPGEGGGLEPPGLDLLPVDGGPVEVPGWAWAWAFSLGSRDTSLGHLVVAAERSLDEDDLFLVRVLALQVGTALRNIRQHDFERAAAAELATVNEQLASTVAELRQRMEIHERLTRTAASGEGMAGIAHAVHEVTGRRVVIEDRFGNIRAWAGGGDPPVARKEPPERREAALRRWLDAGRSVHEDGVLLQAVSPRPGSVAVISVVDDGELDAADVAALEYGATILSLEVARLRSQADTEVRLRRDLLEDLLSGTNLESAVQRAEAFQHDLTRPHRVAVLEVRGGSRDADQTFNAVRRAARDSGAGTLVVSRAGSVVLVTDQQVVWEGLCDRVDRELGRGSCSVGVSSATEGVEDFKAAWREARIALDLLRDNGTAQRVALFDELGVYRLLANTEDPREVERFVRRWLGPLIDYDEQRKADLTRTLSTYLEKGGRYAETADALTVHRSTLKYRLQRIREITGMQLGDPDVDFNLQLACRAWRTLEALRV